MSGGYTGKNTGVVEDPGRPIEAAPVGKPA